MLWFVSKREARSEKEPKTQLLTWCGYPIEEENEQEAAGANVVETQEGRQIKKVILRTP